MYKLQSLKLSKQGTSNIKLHSWKQIHKGLSVSDRKEKIIQQQELSLLKLSLFEEFFLDFLSVQTCENDILLFDFNFLGGYL